MTEAVTGTQALRLAAALEPFANSDINVSGTAAIGIKAADIVEARDALAEWNTLTPPSPDASGAMREAVAAAARVFRDYERQHAAKMLKPLTPLEAASIDAKVRRNRLLADQMEAALAAPEPGAAVAGEDDALEALNAMHTAFAGYADTPAKVEAVAIARGFLAHPPASIREEENGECDRCAGRGIGADGRECTHCNGRGDLPKSAATPADEVERKTVARLLDPREWEEAETYRARADEWFAKGRTGDNDPLVQGYHDKADAMQAALFAKADAILNALRSGVGVAVPAIASANRAQRLDRPCGDGCNNPACCKVRCFHPLPAPAGGDAE